MSKFKYAKSLYDISVTPQYLIERHIEHMTNQLEKEMDITFYYSNVLIKYLKNYSIKPTKKPHVYHMSGKNLNVEKHLYVKQLREDGKTFTEIGKILDLSRQRVCEMYKHVIE